ncbi:hypothetical protein [Gluconacetobacter diazotrophicus]|uniref:hypothetical protein n=1 Tax=Gluconacetobacter diazotrophicus TaxID=33996 RepID=UPI000173B413
MNWVFGEGITETYLESAEVFGFIYRIDFENDCWYIGKKQTHSYRKIPSRKLDGSKSLYKKTISKTSDWKTYNSSSIHVLELISKGVPYTKEIIEVVEVGGSLEYLEARYLFKNDALEDPMCLNKNIMGRFFKK